MPCHTLRAFRLRCHAASPLSPDAAYRFRRYHAATPAFSSPLSSSSSAVSPLRRYCRYFFAYVAASLVFAAMPDYALRHDEQRCYVTLLPAPYADYFRAERAPLVFAAIITRAAAMITPAILRCHDAAAIIDIDMIRLILRHYMLPLAIFAAMPLDCCHTDATLFTLISTLMPSLSCRSRHYDAFAAVAVDIISSSPPSLRRFRYCCCCRRRYRLRWLFSLQRMLICY